MKRVFHPGEEWLYIRLYTGPDTCEEWLAEVLPVVVKELQDKGMINCWFFVKYLDPHYHLRIRFHLLKDEYMSDVVKIIKDFSLHYYSNELIWKLEIGSYDRELKRYGDWIESTEDIFSYDSDFWLGILSEIRNDKDGEEKRWQAAAYNVHLIFNAFGIEISDRIVLLNKMYDSLFHEMGGGKKLKLMLDEKFRARREQLEIIFSNPDELKIEGFKLAAELRSKRMAKLHRENNPVKSNDKERRMNFVSDIIHMSSNRGFRSKHRLHELVIYSFVKQLYISAEARKR